MQPPWTRKIDFSEKPIFVCWETTKSCLLSCRHCRATAIRSGLPGELDAATGLRLIDQIVEFSQPYPALLFTGGDPLMRPDVFDLIQHAAEKGLHSGGGKRHTPAGKRSAGKDEVTRRGSDLREPGRGNRLRSRQDPGHPGTWQATLDAVTSATSCGLRLQVNTTVMKSNLSQLADIFHLIRERGAVAWEVFFLVRTGRGSSLENPEPWECEEVGQFLYECTQYGIPVRTSEGPHFRRISLQRQKDPGPPRGKLYSQLAQRLRELEGEPKNPPTVRLSGTGDGKGIIFIGHDGEVYPSGFLPLPLGNIKNESLKSIYTSNPMLMGLRDPSRLKGRCGACEYASVCGGSRSRAYAEFEDPYQEDPACIYVPQGGAMLA